MKRSLLVFLTGMAVSFGSGCDSATKEAGGGGTGGHLGGQSGGVGQAGAAGSSAAGTPGAAGAAGWGGTGGSETGSSGHSGVGGATGASGGGAGDHLGGGSGGGAGDHPAGGAGGQGGQPIDAGQTCAQLMNEFNAALVAAAVCTPGAANQCHQLAPIVLADCPACSEAWVNDATTLVAIQKQWFAACAKPVPCLAISCVAILPSACASISPTTGGPNAGASPGGVCTVN